MRLRVKDVDFARGEIVVRQGKGAKDRMTVRMCFPPPLPAAAGDELRRVRAIEWRFPRGHAMTRALRGTRIRIALAALIAIGGAAGVLLLSGGASADGQKARGTSTVRWLPLAPSPLQRTEVGAARIGRFLRARWLRADSVGHDDEGGHPLRHRRQRVDEGPLDAGRRQSPRRRRL